MLRVSQESLEQNCISEELKNIFNDSMVKIIAEYCKYVKCQGRNCPHLVPFEENPCGLDCAFEIYYGLNK
jgi:hypothetical protein